MCCRYIPNTEEEIAQIREILDQLSVKCAQFEALSGLAGDVCPTQVAPVMIMRKHEAHIRKIKWGFEKWDGKGVVINARSETLPSGKFFAPYSANRCLIPAHGYYEWLTLPDKKKVKFVFTDSQQNGIFIAGLYRINKGAGEFVILTKNADSNIRPVHDRMPLLIKPPQLVRWLDGTLALGQICGSDNDDMVCREAM